MSLLDTVRSKREEILAAASRYGASNVRIFGSVVRGEETPESDVDVLVDMETGRSLMDQAALLLELEHLLGRKVDVVTERGLKSRIKDRVMRESVQL